MLAEGFALTDDALDTGRPYIWLAVDGWHKGLLGLVAGRVAERFGLPTFVTLGSPTGRERARRARSPASILAAW